MVSSSLPWATVRSVIVIAGVGFTAASIGSACLDYAGEDYGAGCDAQTTSSSSASSTSGGSGLIGSGAVVPTPTEADCGAP